MKIIYNSIIPFGRFVALTLLIWLFIKRGKELTERLLNHEKIHMRQQLEIVAACLVINATIIGLMGCSWWWMLASIVAPFIMYGISIGIEILLPPYDQAYRNSCFETEAIYNEHKPSYTRRWWRHLFGWVRNIPNRKYPYIPHRERPPMQDW